MNLRSCNAAILRICALFLFVYGVDSAHALPDCMDRTWLSNTRSYEWDPFKLAHVLGSFSPLKWRTPPRVSLSFFRPVTQGRGSFARFQAKKNADRDVSIRRERVLPERESHTIELDALWIKRFRKYFARRSLRLKTHEKTANIATTVMTTAAVSYLNLPLSGALTWLLPGLSIGATLAEIRNPLVPNFRTEKRQLHAAYLRMVKGARFERAWELDHNFGETWLIRKEMVRVTVGAEEQRVVLWKIWYPVCQHRR